MVPNTLLGSAFGVWKPPGSMMLTFIPKGRISGLRAFENASTPYLLIPYDPFKSGHSRPVALIDQLQLASKPFLSPLCFQTPSETQGQLVGPGKNLNGREKDSGEEKSRRRRRGGSSSPSWLFFARIFFLARLEEVVLLRLLDYLDQDKWLLVNKQARTQLPLKHEFVWPRLWWMKRSRQRPLFSVPTDGPYIHARAFLRRGRQPEENIWRARTVVSPRFLY